MGAVVLCGFGGDIVDELGEDEGVVLEKVAGEEVEVEAVDFFTNNGAMIGLDPVGMGAKEKGDSFLEGGGAVFGVLANGGEDFVNLRHSNGALGYV